MGTIGRRRGRLGLLLSVCIGAAACLVADGTGAGAAPLVTCSAASHVLSIGVSGSSSDALVISTSSGTYQIDLDNSPVCSQTISDAPADNPTVQVTENSSPFVPTTFQPGSDAGITFDGPGGTTTALDLSFAPAPDTVTLNGDSTGSPGSVTMGAGADSFSGVSSFIGSGAGSTSFVAGATGGYSFSGLGTGNTLDLSGDAHSVTANLTTGLVTVGASASDTFSGIGRVVGSASGGNTFVAGGGSASFADSGSGAGDTVDFSQVATSALSPLTVNLSGATVSVSPSGPLPNDNAVVGSSTYSFSSGGSNFTTFDGAASGNTTFLGGATAGENFVGAGTGNVADFSADANPVSANLSTGLVGVGPSATDTVSGISRVVGSAAGGNSFVAGTGLETFSDSGSGNTFSLGASPAVIVDPAAGNTIDFSALTAALTLNVAGVQVGPTANDTASTSTATYSFSGGPTSFVGSSGGTTFDAGATGGYSFDAEGSGNLADFSGDPDPVTANLSTGIITVGPSASDTISGIPDVVGSSQGANHFVAGSGSETFGDSGSVGGDSLDFSQLSTSPVTPLTVNVSGGPSAGPPNDAASVGPTEYSFSSTGSDITTFEGATTGNTTFLAGPTGGHSFVGQGSGNTLDLSAAGATSTVTVNGDSVASPGAVTGLSAGPGASTTDAFSDIQSFAGLTGDTITSVNHTTVSRGAAFSFTVTTFGSSVPKFTKKGALPKGLVFHDNANGTATIFGVPTAKKARLYHLTITATFGRGKTKTVLHQPFTLALT